MNDEYGCLKLVLKHSVYVFSNNSVLAFSVDWHRRGRITHGAYLDKFTGNISILCYRTATIPTCKYKVDVTTEINISIAFYNYTLHL